MRKYNKKSELMLVRRATQSVSVYLQTKMHSSSMCLNIRSRKIHETLIFGFQSRSRSSMLVLQERLLAVPICNRSHAWRV